MQTGASPGGDSSEAEPEQPHPAAGGGEEWSPGAAGGGGGGQEESGETSAGPAVPGARAPPGSRIGLDGPAALRRLSRTGES